MGAISWIEINAGELVPEALGQVGSGSLRQGGEQAWDGHLEWVPGAVFLNSVFSLTLFRMSFICRVAYFQETKEQVLEVSAVVFVLCCSYAKNLKLERRHQEERR